MFDQYLLLSTAVNDFKEKSTSGLRKTQGCFNELQTCVH